MITKDWYFYVSAGNLELKIMHDKSNSLLFLTKLIGGGGIFCYFQNLRGLIQTLWGSSNLYSCPPPYFFNKRVPC